ncbi:metallophosphoesterase family protein [Acidisoma sp. 7E03]
MKLTFKPAPGRLPPDLRIYAIGDVHGCDEAHAAIFDRIAVDYAARPVEEVVIVHMGDLIDRGPNSAAVLARIAQGPPIPGEMVNLRGNHEDLCLTAIDGGGETASLWRRNGGEACLADWGVPKKTPVVQWERHIPPEQLAVIRHQRIFYRRGGYFFAHAGLRPGVPMMEQDPHDLVWIREPFLSWPHPHEAIVVHGHTPKKTPILRINRIGIDTGAVYGGKLTCLVLEEDRMAFIQVPGPKKPRK